MFQERWLAILIGIAGGFAARATGLFMLVPLLSMAASGQDIIERPCQMVLLQGGLRGAVTLALSLPTSMDFWWTSGGPSSRSPQAVFGSC